MCCFGLIQIYGNEVRLMVCVSSSVELSLEHKVSPNLSAGEISAFLKQFYSEILFTMMQSNIVNVFLKNYTSLSIKCSMV